MSLNSIRHIRINFATFRQLTQLSTLKYSTSAKEEETSKTTNGGDVSDIDFIRARSFLKHLKPYEPADDVETKLGKLVAEISSVDDGDWKNVVLNNKLKFILLTKCENVFGKLVPNSYLHEMRTAGDVVEFYKSRVDVVAPYNRLARSRESLPNNLHIIEECVRYDPERDGPTAYPKTDVNVFNPKYQRMYKGYKSPKDWHHFEEAEYSTKDEPPSAAPWTEANASKLDTISSATMTKKRKKWLNVF